MNLKKEIKFFFIKYVLTFPGYYILNLFTKTLRLGLENEGTISDHLERGGIIVLASWHQRFFGGLYLPRILGRPICVMISQSRDGDYTADIAKRIGWIPARGSRTRGGKQALRTLVDEIARTRIAGHVVDGPTGPHSVIKPGLISLAQKSGAVICPVYIFYENAWKVNSWDRFMIPKPFSRVVIRFGPLESIPEEMDAEAFEGVRLRIERKMLDEYERGDRCLGGRSRVG